MPVTSTYVASVNVTVPGQPSERVTVVVDPQTRKMTFTATSGTSMEAAIKRIRDYLQLALAQVPQ